LNEEVNHPEDRDLRSADPGRVGLLQGHLTTGSVPPVSTGGARYRLRPSIEPFVDRHGVLCFVWPGGRDVVVRDPSREDIALVELLKTASHSAGSLATSLGVEASSVQRQLDSLVDAGLVLRRDEPESPPLIGDEAARFSRQLPYLAELGDEVALQRRIRGASVVVLGCGGLGTWAIAALACIGVGNLVLVDDDVVALSNLNRQILYGRADVDEPKVATSQRWLHAFDPAIDVTSVERRLESATDAAAVIGGADAVVLAADWPPYEIGRWVNAACVDAQVPFIVAGQLPPVLKVGPTYMAGKGACLACHETALADESYAYEDYVSHRSSDSGTASTVGPASAIAGGMIGLELLHLLAGRSPATRDFALIMHMQTLEVHRAPIARDPSCTTCKHLW
jgi:molybdopterin-synthase adenylyltransferase